MDLDHHQDGGIAVEAIVAVPFAFALVCYLAMAATQARRGSHWPWHRSIAWVLGVAAAASGFLGPLAGQSHGSLTAHMVVHALVGMVAPLLLVLAAPVTLALRSLDVVPARRLSRLLNTLAGQILIHPVVAATLNVAGMWLVYRSPLYGLMQQNMLVHLAVMAHFLVAGYLFTASIIPIDPAPHRSSYQVRGVVLVLSLAAHGILAKTLYASPPAGVSLAEARTGGFFMYYAGDAVDIAIIAILCAQWYRHAGRSRVRSTHRLQSVKR